MSDSNETSKEEAPSAEAPEPSVRRTLKSFSTDLEVVVGTPPNQETFACHGLILASYSAYIDSMLALPMREKTTRRVTFPDIEPAVWNKMMSFLEPGGSEELKLSDLATVLPFYDKYDFRTGLLLCDKVLSNLLNAHKKGQLQLEGEFAELFISTVVLAYELQLGKSSKEAIGFASRIVARLRYGRYTATQINALMPLAIEDDTFVRYLVETMMGMDADGLSRDDMVHIVQEDTFADRLIARDDRIHGQEEILRQLYISRLSVTLLLDGDEGEHPLLAAACHDQYQRQDYQLDLPGAMGVYWSRTIQLPPEHNRPGQIQKECVVRAMDPFGKTWQMRVEASDCRPAHVPACLGEEEKQDPVCEVLLEWKSDYSSLVPPHNGWVKFVRGQRVPTNCEVRYDIGNRY